MQSIEHPERREHTNDVPWIEPRGDRVTLQGPAHFSCRFARIWDAVAAGPEETGDEE